MEQMENLTLKRFRKRAHKPDKEPKMEIVLPIDDL